MEENKVKEIKIEEVTMRYPPPYTVDKGCLCREVTGKDGTRKERLCNFLPFIKEEQIIDDGADSSLRLVMGGFKEGGIKLPDAEIAGNELKNFDWVIEKWGSRLYYFCRQHGQGSHTLCCSAHSEIRGT